MNAALLTLALLSAPAAPSSAGDDLWPCAPLATQSGPVTISYESGGLGSPRRACPRTEFSLGLRGQAIAEAQNFYGNIQASTPIGGSIAIDDRLEFHLSFEVFHLRNVIQTVAATHAGFGHTQLGATVVVLHEGQLVVSAVTRTTLPTALGLYNNAWPIGLDAGFAFAWGLSDRILIHGSLMGSGSMTLSAAPYARLGYSSAIGFEYVPAEWLTLAVTGSSLTLYQFDLDHASLAAAARLRVWDGLAFELYAGAPFGGRERNLAHGGLALTWRVE